MRTCTSLLMTVKPETCLLHEKHHELDLASQAADRGRSCGSLSGNSDREQLFIVRPAQVVKLQLKHGIQWPSVVSRPGEATAQQAGDSFLQRQASPIFSSQAAHKLPGWPGQMPGSQASCPCRSGELLLHTSATLTAPVCSSRLCYLASSEHVQTLHCVCAQVEERIESTQLSEVVMWGNDKPLQMQVGPCLYTCSRAGKGLQPPTSAQAPSHLQRGCQATSPWIRQPAAIM